MTPLQPGVLLNGLLDIGKTESHGKLEMEEKTRFRLTPIDSCRSLSQSIIFQFHLFPLPFRFANK